MIFRLLALSAVVLVLVAATPSEARAAADVPLYVSPEGSDDASGLAPSRDRPSEDGPKATLAAALRAATAGGHRTILMETGDWYLTEPIALTAAQDGMTIRAAPGARPVLHGGRDLSELSWRDVGGGLLAASLDPQIGDTIDRLVQNDRPLHDARFPNAVPGDTRGGWLFAAAGTSGHREIRVDPAALPELEVTASLRVLVMDANQWTSNVARVESIDRAAGIIRLADNVPWHLLGEGSRFYLFGTQELLDAADEWAWDGEAKRLLVKPENPAAFQSGHRLVGGTLDSLITIDGASDVTIEGLTLRDGTTHGSDRSRAYLQIGGGAIRVIRSDRVTLADNVIAQVGVGLSLLDVQDSVLRGNRIEGVDGNGIFVGMPWGGSGSRGVRLEGNDIRDTGRRFVETAGIFVTGLSGGQVIGNRIRYSAQFGVYGGQMRDTGEDAIRDLLIERNVIRRVNTSTADGGGIKLFATRPGLSSGHVIRANWVDGVTHLMNRADGSFFAPDDWVAARWPQPIAAGIYLDTNQRGVRIEGNIVTRSYGGVLVVDSSDSLIMGNVISSGWGTAVELAQSRRPDEPMEGNRVEANVVLRDAPASIAVRIYDADGGPPLAAFARNRYDGAAIDGDAFRIDVPRSQRGLVGNLNDWVASSRIADAEILDDGGFADPAHGDFRRAASRSGDPAPTGLDSWLVDAVRDGFRDGDTE